jgi:N-acetylmuramoyl-L-alanine amidase
VFSSLEERVQKSNSTDDAIFLSVHVSKSTAAEKRGNSYELGVGPKSGNYNKSILLASAIASKLKNQKTPVDVVDHGKAYVIRENRHPALIIECGNLDDADNIALLKDEARTEVLCRNILSGIVDYNAKITTK